WHPRRLSRRSRPIAATMQGRRSVRTVAPGRERQDFEPSEDRVVEMVGQSSNSGSADGRGIGARHAPRRPINSLSRFVARIPVRSRTNLRASLAVVVVVLVIIGGLGLRVLGESNARFGTLAALQRKAATYRALQDQNTQLRELLAARSSLFPGVAVPSDDS